MSDNPQSPSPGGTDPRAAAARPARTGAPAPRKRHPVLRFFGWTFLSIVLLLTIVAVGLTWYTTTADFQRRVGTEVKSVLEDSTGGKVDLGHISIDLWHLAIEVDGLVIHGTEGPGEAPYLSAAKILVRLKINTVISHTVGEGAQSRIGLNYLEVDQPHAHLIVDKDGKTNQPVPKHPSTSTEPVQDSLLDLQAEKVLLNNGLVLVNDRAIPFDAAANDLNAQVHYIPSTDRYGISVDLADLQTHMAKEPMEQSKLHLNLELGRDMAALQSFDFDSGLNTHLAATALIYHFADPAWQASVNGGINLKQLGYLAGIDGFTSGVVNLDIHGRNCQVTPQTAQKDPHFWQHHGNETVPLNETLLPPSADCKSGYLLAGNVKAHDAGFVTPDVRLHNVNAGAQLRVTPTELLFSALTGYLPGGGTVAGELKIEDWLGEVPPSAPSTSPTTVAAAKTANNAAKNVGAAPPVQSVDVTPVQRAHAFAKVTLKGITLRTILDITAPNKIGDLGLDTQVSGPVTAEWGGPAADIADTVQVGADLTLSPFGEHRRNVSNVPVSGRVLAQYDGRTEVVNIQEVNLQTPGTSVNASGVLGVNNGDPLTNLSLNLQARDLAEFDQTLQTLGFQANGKKGSAALPVVLHGSLAFNGTAKGAIRNIDVKGHLAANNIEVQLGTTTNVQLDSVVADAEYAPSRGVVVGDSTITRGTAVLNLAGTAVPHRVVSRRGVVSYDFDKYAAVNATVKLANAQIPDLLQIAGQGNKIPVTGTINVNAQIAGTVGNLNGKGNITLTKGVAYNEPYQTVSVDATVLGQQINATRLLVQAQDVQVTGAASYNLTTQQAVATQLVVASAGQQITGSGSYNLNTKQIAAQLSGQGIRLSKIAYLQKQFPDDDAVVSLNLSANGTAQEPNLQAQLSLTDVVVQGKALGQLNATAHSTGSTVFYNLNSALVGAQIAATGQTVLTGDYQTQARLTLSGVDVAKAVALFSPGSTDATSNIAGTVTLSGPAAKPQQLTATADFSTFIVTAQGVTLKQTEPIRIGLRNGTASIDSLHITGPDTDLSASGTAVVFGDTNPQGGTVDVHATGNIDLAIGHIFDPQLITSGKVNFGVGVAGRLKNPALTGRVNFDNANIAIDGIPNGLSNLTGSMVFNENRLEVENISGTSGGGKITLKGYVGYQKGLFSDLTASIDTVRIRYAGLSTTTNATIRLQGSQRALFLSGNVLITRFGVGPDVDFAAFAGTGGISVPPDPTSILNNIRRDVHVASAPQLDFQNSYAKIAGTVDLNVRGTAAVPSVLGTIRITDGSATFAGTSYELERGIIYFSNPVRINPTIDLDVTTQIENYDITIGVHGDATNLKPIYRSSPPLTEADIFNLLALGKTQEESQISSQQQTEAGTDPTTSAILSGALNATISSRVGKLFGAGSVKIDPAYTGVLGQSTARITVQEPLTKQVTVTFATNVNESAEQLIQVSYQLTENTSIVATRDEAGVFSVVYKIRKRYR